MVLAVIFVIALMCLSGQMGHQKGKERGFQEWRANDEFEWAKLHGRNDDLFQRNTKLASELRAAAEAMQRMNIKLEAKDETIAAIKRRDFYTKPKNERQRRDDLRFQRTNQRTNKRPKR